MLPHSPRGVNQKFRNVPGTGLTEAQVRTIRETAGPVGMDLKAIIELLGEENGPADEVTAGLLEAVASFSSTPGAATSAIRQLQAGNPSGFAFAAVRLLAGETERSAGMQYVAGLFLAGNLLIPPLLDEAALPLGAAIALARNLSARNMSACNVAAAEPALDSRLLQKLLTNAGGEVQSIQVPAALRALRLVEAISDCSRLSSYLIQLLRHPSPEVRSKVALLLGRANFNLTRVKQLLASDDARLRANTVESLWGNRSVAVQQVLREASKDSSGRTSMNALLELTRQGDQEAFERIRQAARGFDATQRARSAWAMGESGNPEFAPLLDKLSEDQDSQVRAMARTSRGKLRQAQYESKDAAAPVVDEEARGADAERRARNKSAA